jgi:methylenetetrahydrofolate dehydrogenase (NADP+)/methenyltetrahydrofolate cyclohydrolase
MQLLDGKTVAQQSREEIKAKVSEFRAEGRRAPHLAAILVGEHAPSQTYVNQKVKDCHEIGFESSLYRLPATVAQEELLARIEKVNREEAIDGLIVQLPLPDQIEVDRVIESIAPEKDVDGFHPINYGRMTKGQDSFLPATPYGILRLLDRYQIEVSSRHAVVLGRSAIVGRPMSILLSGTGHPGNATVTLCHSRTRDLPAITRQADLLVVALGKTQFVTADMVGEGAVVVDVGINRVDDATKKRGFRLVGDVDFEAVAPKCAAITPVPGGVGPMTRVGLLLNTLTAYERRTR